MSEQYEHYQFCERCLAQATAIINDLKQGCSPNINDIRCQRRKDRIALKTLYDALRRTFITHIDREDLWLLCTASQRVLLAAEDLTLRVDRAGLFANEDWSSLQSVCLALQKAVVAFPRFQRDETFFTLADTVQSQLLTAKNRLDFPAGAHALLDACDALADALLTAALKNE